PARTSRERLREFREYRERHGRSGLLGHELDLAIANVLSAETDRVTATQTRVEQHVDPYAFPGADRPPTLVHRDIVLSPRRIPWSLLATRSIDIRRRVDLHQPRLLRRASSAGDGGLILVVEIRRSEFGTKPNTWPLADTHLLGDTLKAFCEVKSPRDDWLDDQIEAASPGQIAGGARSDPTFNRIARHVDKAASQFDA